MDSLYDLDLISDTVPVILDNSKLWYQVLSTSMKLGPRGVAHVEGINRVDLKEDSHYSNLLLINRTASRLSWWVDLFSPLMEIFFLFFSNIVWVLNIELDWVFLEPPYLWFSSVDFDWKKHWIIKDRVSCLSCNQISVISEVFENFCHVQLDFICYNYYYLLEKNPGYVSAKSTCCTSCSPCKSLQISHDFKSLLFLSRTRRSDNDSSSGLWSARIETTVVL